MERRREKSSVAYVFSVIALILAILSILIVVVYTCVRFPRDASTQFDYLGFIVGIMAFLITILLGWNIYALIDIRQSKDYIDDKLTDYDHEISGGLYQAMGMSKFDQEAYGDALFMFVYGIKEQNMCAKQIYTDNLIEGILKIEEVSPSICLSSEKVKEYEEILIKCNHKEIKNAITFIKNLEREADTSKQTPQTRLNTPR